MTCHVMAEPLFLDDVPWEPNQHFPSLLFLKLAFILHIVTYMFNINCRDNGSLVCFFLIYLPNRLYFVLGDGTTISVCVGFFLFYFFCMFVFLPCFHLVLLEVICLLFSDVYKNVRCHGPVVYLVYIFFSFSCVLYHITAIFIDSSSYDVSNEKKYMKRNKQFVKMRVLFQIRRPHERKQCFWPAGVSISEN